MNDCRFIFVLFFLCLVNSARAADVQSEPDSILVKVRNHQFEDAAKIISGLKLQGKNTQKNLFQELEFYNILSASFGMYKAKKPQNLTHIKSNEPYLEALTFLNTGLYQLLYEKEDDSEAYNNLLKSLQFARNTQSKVLQCEVLKAILLYYSRLINIVNQDFVNFSKQHQNAAYDKTEQDIAKITQFFLKLEEERSEYSKEEISDMKKISVASKVKYYRNSAAKNLGIYYEVHEKNMELANRYYDGILKDLEKSERGVEVYLFETTVACKMNALNKEKKFQEVIDLANDTRRNFSGKTEDYYQIFRMAMVADAFAGIKKFDSAYYYKEKSRVLKNNFEQSKHNAEINLLNSKIKDLEISKQQDELSDINRKTAFMIIVFALLLISVFTYLYFSKMREKEFRKTAQIKLDNQRLQSEVERQKSILEERKRISLDMHDDLGAGISAMKLQAEFLKKKVNDADFQEDIDDLLKTSESMNLSMREMLWNLNSKNDNIDHFVEYVSSYAENFFRRSDIKIHVSKSIIEAKTAISAETRRNLFLCIKESLNNIYKHSKAENVWLSFTETEKQFSILIQDDGIGSKNGNFSEAGNGISNMKKRIADIKGDFEIFPSEKGTDINCTVHLF